MKERVEKHLEGVDKILYFSNFKLGELVGEIKKLGSHGKADRESMSMYVNKLEGCENYEVQPGEQLNLFVKRLEMSVGEGNLEMVERKDGTYLLIAYDSIGSRWLNIFKKEEVEKMLRDNHEKN